MGRFRLFLARCRSFLAHCRLFQVVPHFSKYRSTFEKLFQFLATLGKYYSLNFIANLVEFLFHCTSVGKYSLSNSTKRLLYFFCTNSLSYIKCFLLEKDVFQNNFLLLPHLSPISAMTSWKRFSWLFATGPPFSAIPTVKCQVECQMLCRRPYICWLHRMLFT